MSALMPPGFQTTHFKIEFDIVSPTGAGAAQFRAFAKVLQRIAENVPHDDGQPYYLDLIAGVNDLELFRDDRCSIRDLHTKWEITGTF